MRSLALICLLALPGCAALEPVAPPANKVAERIMTKRESPQVVQRWLVSRGFSQISRTGFGGVWPRTGPCYQTEKGLRIKMRTITRVCWAADKHPVVLTRETRGYYWTEVFPRDLSYNLNGPIGLGAISDETVEILKQ